MFARVFALLPLAFLVAASQASNECNTGSIQCCSNVQSASDANNLLSAYNLVDAAAAVGGLVGSDCSPLTLIGTGSGCSADQQPVCCENNNFNGLVNIGCSPVNINA